MLGGEVCGYPIVKTFSEIIINKMEEICNLSSVIYVGSLANQVTSHLRMILGTCYMEGSSSKLVLWYIKCQ